jgi:hypothetical protein
MDVTVSFRLRMRALSGRGDKSNHLYADGKAFD